MEAKGLQIVIYSSLPISLLESPKELLKIVISQPSLDQVSQNLWGGSWHLNVSKIFQEIPIWSQGFQPWEPWLHSLASGVEGRQVLHLPNLRCDN